jgi:hypothetical protein
VAGYGVDGFGVTASRKLLAASGAAGPFNPETSITWHSLFWAEGTDFVAQGYSDTDSVTTWPNETGEQDAAEATNPPTYDAVNTEFNNQPVVDFDGTNDTLATAAFSSGPSYASGVSFVVIGRTENPEVGAFFEGNTVNNALFDSTGERDLEQYRIQAGAAITSAVTTVNTSAHLHVVFFDGSTGSDTLTTDGTSLISGAAGSGQATLIKMSASAKLSGQIAFLGIYEGDITANGSWANFETWVTDHYGITIA